MADLIEIEEAATRLANLLREANADGVLVHTTLSKISSAVIPSLTDEEQIAEQRVEEALAAQRAVALLRTEARLHFSAAERCSRVVTRLEHMKSYDSVEDNEEIIDESERFKRSVILPESTETMQRYKLAEESADAAVQREKDFVDLRRKACESVAKLCRKSELSFNRLFVEALQFTNGVQGAMNVYKICTEISEQQHPGRQSIPDGLSKTSSEYLTWLRGEAANILSGDTSQFKSLLDYVANENRGCATLAPIKGYKRTLQKVQDKYTGDFSKVLDLARGMVVFDSIGELANALKYIKSQHDKRLDNEPLIIRAKDRLSTKFDAGRFTNGYRDVLLNLCFDGHVVECQLLVASFLDLKNRWAHNVYEKARSIHMFNEAFTKRRYAWLADSDEDEIVDLLEDIRSGALTSINLDYSTALYSPENQSLLAEAFLDERCRLRDISLRSCRCGDDFIMKCLPLPSEVTPDKVEEIHEMWSDSRHGHIGNILRLGSKLHAGTAGRVSSVGIRRVILYLNESLRDLDLEGCLDLYWTEDTGDTVASTFVKLADEFESKDRLLLPQLQKLNLKSTGLTADGKRKLDNLKASGHLRQSTILTDEKLSTGPPLRPKVACEGFEPV